MKFRVLFILGILLLSVPSWASDKNNPSSSTAVAKSSGTLTAADSKSNDSFEPKAIAVLQEEGKKWADPEIIEEITKLDQTILATSRNSFIPPEVRRMIA